MDIEILRSLEYNCEFIVPSIKGQEHNQICVVPDWYFFFFFNTTALVNLVSYWVDSRKVNCLPCWSNVTIRGMC